MKKFLIYIFLFFGLVMVVDFVFDKLCNFLTDHAKGGFVREIKISVKEQTADLLIMGSSRAHRHYVPSVFSDTLGITAHNAGVDGNGIVTAAGLYPLISVRYRPVVVIYDVTTNFDIYKFVGDDNDTRY